MFQETLESAALPPGYPRELETSLCLKDGRSVVIRPLAPVDAPALEQVVETVDRETLYQRFFTRHPRLDASRIAHLTNLDYQWRLALVAVHHGHLAGIVRYEGEPHDSCAEVGLVVDRPWRNAGLATAMLRELEKAALARGIVRLKAYYLEDNPAIAALLRRFGYAPPRVIHGVAETSKALLTVSPTDRECLAGVCGSVS